MVGRPPEFMGQPMRRSVGVLLQSLDRGKWLRAERQHDLRRNGCGPNWFLILVESVRDASAMMRQAGPLEV